jgi:predicted DNA-binding transcriptional regulator AlpA
MGESDGNSHDMVERLGAAGCTDALIGIGQSSRLALEFTREAATAELALISALTDVKAAVPNAQLIEAAPDFVGLTDVAEVVGVTRQNLRKLMLGYGANFPLPVHEGSATVWHLADMLEWLKTKVAYQIEPATLAVAQVNKQVNLAKQALQIAPNISGAVNLLVA